MGATIGVTGRMYHAVGRAPFVTMQYDIAGLDLTEAAGVTPRIAAKLLLDVLGGVFAT